MRLCFQGTRGILWKHVERLSDTDTEIIGTCGKLTEESVDNKS